MKRLLLLSIFLLAGCWLNKTVSTRPVDVPKEIPNTNSGNIVSQTWTTETLLQTWQNLSGVQTMNEDEKIINFTGVLNQNSLILNLPKLFGNSYVKRNNLIEDISRRDTTDTYLDNQKKYCGEIWLTTYHFFSSGNNNRLILNLPKYDFIKSLTGENYWECKDIITNFYDKYEKIISWKIEINYDSNKCEISTNFSWINNIAFKGDIIKNKFWEKIWIEYYDWYWLIWGECWLDSKVTYNIEFIDKTGKLTKIIYDFDINFERTDIKDYSDYEWILYIYQKDIQNFFNNIYKYNPTDYANIQSIKKWVLDYLSSEK